MKKLLLTIALTLGIGVVSAITSPAVFADDNNANDALEVAPALTVSPATAGVSLKPGASVDYTLVVTNDKAESLNISAYVAPYSIQNENYDIDFDKQTNRTQLSRWIKFVNADGSVTDNYKATVPGNSKSYVNYRVTVPEDIPAGGQYAAIFVQTGDDAKPLESSGLQAVSRVGVIIYGRGTGETEEKAEVTNLSVPSFMTGGPVVASALVTNTGNTDIEVEHSFTVTSIVGTEIYHSEGKDPVLPDAARRVKSEWENTQPMGIFRISYKVSVLGDSYEINKLIIILPAYMIVIAIFVLTLLIIWIIILIRKRRERKSKFVV